jgi:Fe-S-cluster containining protein
VSPGATDLARSWLAAAAPAHPAALELDAIFTDTARAITERAPACWASGRCCNFDAFGHRLYVTGLETAYTLLRLPPARAITPADVVDARARGGCPFQAANLCGIHTIKPLACRLFFCDRTAQTWQQDLHELMIRRLRDLHDRHAVEYRYAEWRDLLDLVLPVLPRTATG